MGNLCRHSAAFYPALVEARHGEESALACVIRCASDDDGATRKFACFALGNAAFHSSDLYAALEPGAPPLCSCLANDSDEKARANAAGALGNLARNGGGLAAALVAAGAPGCSSPRRARTPRPGLGASRSSRWARWRPGAPCAASSRLSRCGRRCLRRSRPRTSRATLRRGSIRRACGRSCRRRRRTLLYRGAGRLFYREGSSS